MGLQDSDSDGLPDCAESNTGVFQTAMITGTDTDLDGLIDGAEVFGTSGGLDLPALGVSPLRKDILIEYDWLEDNLNSCVAHSHRPSDEALQVVEDIFAGAVTIQNPDGTTGINVIQDKGQGGALSGGNLIIDADGVLDDDLDSGEFVSYKAANFAPNRQGYFHYAIMAHRYGIDEPSSGLAEILGDDFIVSLGCVPANPQYDPNWTGFTIVHELGHNLGLFHGGDSNCNYKPNYNSLMNYDFQFDGIDIDCDGDPEGDLSMPQAGVGNFSFGNNINIDENLFNENLGTCGTVAVDLNENGTIESSATANLNPEPNADCGPALTILNDYDDWGNIQPEFIRNLGPDSNQTGFLLSPTIESCQPTPVIP